MNPLARLRHSFGAKLLAAQLLVVVAGALTLLAVALSVGPILFHRHIRDALGVVPPDVARHLDTAFNQSTLVALGIAAAAAIVTALGVSWFVSSRVTDTLATLARASTAIAGGAYETRVPIVGEDEIGELARSFNEMAVRLDTTERRRRELLSDVAHELRTPLATIDGYVEAVADGVIEPDQRIWTAVRIEVARLARLADDLQKVSRAEERQLDLIRAPTDSADLVEAAVSAAAPSFDAKGAKLEREIAAGLGRVAIDHDRTGEVFANLLENALRHTPPGGRVVVSATAKAHTVEFAVTDSGEGIEPAHLPRIFERFYRVNPARDRASGGSGIGLAIAKAIIEAQNGTIRAESVGSGHGTTIRITFPTVP